LYLTSLSRPFHFSHPSQKKGAILLVMAATQEKLLSQMADQVHLENLLKVALADYSQVVAV
jgi:hypothetical protein